MPYAPRNCEVCANRFIPPSTGGRPNWWRRRCPSCRRATDPTAVPSAIVEGHSAAAPIDDTPPLKQAVIDLETFTLDRGWGVLLLGTVLIHGGGKPSLTSYRLKDYAPWHEGVRSNDSELARDILEALDPCHVIYAHNGARFDIPWLRSLALKYDLDWREKKLIDPCSIAWRKYRIGRNSLSNLADFLELPEDKLHVAPDVWRKALMDDDDEAWAILQERCESDVRLLNAVAGKVTRDVGMINTRGSAF